MARPIGVPRQHGGETGEPDRQERGRRDGVSGLSRVSAAFALSDKRDSARENGWLTASTAAGVRARARRQPSKATDRDEARTAPEFQRATARPVPGLVLVFRAGVWARRPPGRAWTATRDRRASSRFLLLANRRASARLFEILNRQSAGFDEMRHDGQVRPPKGGNSSTSRRCAASRVMVGSKIRLAHLSDAPGSPSSPRVDRPLSARWYTPAVSVGKRLLSREPRPIHDSRAPHDLELHRLRRGGHLTACCTPINSLCVGANQAGLARSRPTEHARSRLPVSLTVAAHAARGQTGLSPRRVSHRQHLPARCQDTQGLVFIDSHFFEHGPARTSPATGRVVCNGRSTRNAAKGLTRWATRQLTWKSGLGFVATGHVCAHTDLRLRRRGWGLTHDREHLILSDGSSSLRFLSGFLQETKKRRARPWRAGEQPQRVGFVAVDLPHVSTDRIARISRASGDVISWIDLTGLLTPGAVTDPEAVLNGIAYDAVRDRLFVTGKLWPKIFEIQLERRR